MGIGRKRIVLVEKSIPIQPYQHEISEAFRPFITPVVQSSELFAKNNFTIELERSDGLKIEDNRICGFKLESKGEKKLFNIKTFLHIKDWIEDYKKVVIARVVLYDSIGNEVNSLDLDLHFDGYSMECDYGSEGFVTPYFSYLIVD